MNKYKHLNVRKSRSPQSSRREVPVHRTTQQMNGSSINAMGVHVQREGVGRDSKGKEG